ncbi:MAG: RAD52 family DNA repair protein, partial [Prochlorococcaceae cyanobacterium]
MTTITAPFTAPSTAAAASPASGSSRFSAEQIAALSAPLNRAKVRQREQGRTTVSYIEGWQVIAEANRIFGFDGWQRQTLQLRCIHQAERLIGARGNGREPKPGWGVTYTARVRVTVGGPGLPLVIREGCGAGHGIDTDLGQAHESALKEAETDAMKRALMTFGNPFGLALYDKQQREVTGSGSSRIPAAGDHWPRGPQVGELSGSTERLRLIPAVPPQQTQPEHGHGAAANDPGLRPLELAAIEQILVTLRGLPRPLLEEFTAGFRRRFQVPADATTIADRISQQRHHDWIEAFLVRHQGQPMHERVA